MKIDINIESQLEEIWHRIGLDDDEVEDQYQEFNRRIQELCKQFLQENIDKINELQKQAEEAEEDIRIHIKRFNLDASEDFDESMPLRERIKEAQEKLMMLQEDTHEQEETFISTYNQMKECFEKHLNPYMLAELRLGSFESEVMKIARAFDVCDVFYGEDAAFEYGSTKELNILHKDSTDSMRFIFMGAIYPYGYLDSLNEAKSVGFKDLQDFNEWYRQGAVEHFAQIDSIGYMVQYWCKFVKFGAQRTTDMATRLCREGAITREQALLYINELDHILDPLAKHDICETMGISQKHFDKIVDTHANRDIVKKDANGVWRRIYTIV